MNNLCRYTGKVIGATVIAGVLYIPLLIGAQAIEVIASPRITNQSQLESRLAEERKKLDEKIEDGVVIRAILGTTDEDIARSKKINENEYEIVLSGYTASESFLRHELYHIADGHADQIKKIHGLELTLKYIFLYESQATIYSVTGLKL